MRSILRSALPILLLLAATPARVAHADPNSPTDNDKAAARPFAMDGLRFVQAGNCKDAVDKLERAEALVHAPTTAVPLAQCDIQLGKVIAGTEILNRVINEPIPPNAPSSWAEAKQQAHGILDAAQPRIAKLHIHVDVPPGVTPSPQVTVDGQPLPSVLLDNDRPTDPGAHHIVARQAGVGDAEADVTLSDGQLKPVSLRLGAAVAAVPAPGAIADPYGAAGPKNAATSGSDGSPPGGAASASTDPSTDFQVALEFGAHLAFALPFGGVNGDNGNSLDHAASNLVIPLWLDFGVRLDSHWYVGSYFSYGVASIAGELSTAAQCSVAGVGCSSNDIRLGVNGQYHVLPGNRFDPWFGLGFGYEWLSFSQNVAASASRTGTATSFNYGDSGWEFVNFQGGMDFRLLDGALGIGPFVSVALTEYVSQSVADANGDGSSVGSSLSNQSFHEWFMFGVRGDYDLKIH